MELEFVKGFLRVDFDDDNDYIELLINVATEYIAAAIGECDYSKSRVKILALTIITDMYDNRTFTTDKTSQKAQYTIRSIITQLQAEQQ